MKVLAVTGSIGSGKSYIVKIFNELGIPSYDSDSRTKLLYDRDKELMNSLINLLGEDIVDNGLLRRDIFAKKIFSDKSLLSEVESLVHPAVLRDFLAWSKVEGEKAPFVIVESAIILRVPIFENVITHSLLVSAPLELKIERVVRRDNISREDVFARLSNQCEDDDSAEKVDFTIFADEKEPLLPQILEIYNKIIDCNGNR